MTTAMRKHRISLVRDFSDAPGGRYRKQGAFSGEAFREDKIRPTLRDYESIEIDLDGALGFPASFLDEAFGKLVDLEGKEIFNRIDLKLTDNEIALGLLRTCVRERGGTID
jgi:hypothetical protein